MVSLRSMRSSLKREQVAEAVVAERHVPTGYWLLFDGHLHMNLPQRILPYFKTRFLFFYHFRTSEIPTVVCELASSPIDATTAILELPAFLSSRKVLPPEEAAKAHFPHFCRKAVHNLEISKNCNTEQNIPPLTA